MTRDQYGAAFQQGFERTVASLMARGANCDEAREIAQEAWVKGWERISQLRDGQFVVDWVNTIARRLHLTSFRRPQLVDLSQMNNDAAVASAINLASIDMRRAVQKCNPHQRQLLEAFLDGYSCPELTLQTGKSLGAIHAELSRARRTLRERMPLTRYQVPPRNSVLRMKAQREQRTHLERALGPSTYVEREAIKRAS